MKNNTPCTCKAIAENPQTVEDMIPTTCPTCRAKRIEANIASAVEAGRRVYLDNLNELSIHEFRKVEDENGKSPDAIRDDDIFLIICKKITTSPFGCNYPSEMFLRSLILSYGVRALTPEHIEGEFEEFKENYGSAIEDAKIMLADYPEAFTGAWAQ